MITAGTWCTWVGSGLAADDGQSLQGNRAYAADLIVPTKLRAWVLGHLQEVRTDPVDRSAEHGAVYKGDLHRQSVAGDASEH